LFSGVTAFIYVVAMNEYDQVMEEDGQTNRMMDALKTWEDVVNNEHMLKVPAILFLNKKDLFKDKIENVDLDACFPDYRGGKNYEKATEFLERKFMEAVSNKRVGKVYPHITQATDSKNIQLVWQNIKDIFIGGAVDDMFGGAPI